MFILLQVKCLRPSTSHAICFVLPDCFKHLQRCRSAARDRKACDVWRISKIWAKGTRVKQWRYHSFCCLGYSYVNVDVLKSFWFFTGCLSPTKEILKSLDNFLRKYLRQLYTKHYFYSNCFTVWVFELRWKITRFEKGYFEVFKFNRNRLSNYIHL